jgi:hypothetical protein
MARVARAYDAPNDPNRTGLPRDPVLVRFLLEADASPFVTRICVGGHNQAHPESVGNVRFDHRNERRSSQECEGEGTTAAGIFPSELQIYQDSALYREVVGPFSSSENGVPLGQHPRDEHALLASETISGEERTDRLGQIDRAIQIWGDVLGTVMAHEAAHALGLVPEGQPGVGLFGGSEDQADLYAHNLDVTGKSPRDPWLMNSGRTFTFEDLAGTSDFGELRFRPLNYAYLRDRVVLVDPRKS